MAWNSLLLCAGKPLAATVEPGALIVGARSAAYLSTRVCQSYPAPAVEVDAPSTGTRVSPCAAAGWGSDPGACQPVESY